MRFPTKLDGWPAIGLSFMLEGGRMDGPDDCDTGPARRRKIAVAAELRKRHGWPLVEEVVLVPCAGGRKAWIKVFSLHKDVIAAAMAAGGAEWLARYWTASVIRHARHTSRRAVRTRTAESSAGQGVR